MQTHYWRRVVNFLILGRWILVALVTAGIVAGVIAFRGRAQRHATEVAQRQQETERMAAAARAEEVRKQETEVQAAEAGRRGEEKRRRLIREYVWPEFVAKEDKPIVVIVVDGQQNYDAAASERVGHALRRAGLPVEWGIFRPAYVASDDFKRLLAGSSDATRDFKPEDYCQRLLCVRLRSTATQLRKPADVVSTQVLATVSVLMPETGRVLASPEVKAVAVGSTEQASLANAFDWLDEELAKKSPDWLPLLKLDPKR